MRRAVVTVAWGSRYLIGAARMAEQLTKQAETMWLYTSRAWPHGAPWHTVVPYAFKPHAIEQARAEGVDMILWLDAAVLPIRSLAPLWERIERDGYWFAENAWNNYQWTADGAYPALFDDADSISSAREANKEIPQVIACAFGLNLRSKIGTAFQAEYLRLAQAGAFIGPWWNSNNPANAGRDPRKCAPCGPPGVIGHRHDQTAASVIAWRLGMNLTPGHRAKDGDYLAYPEWFERGGCNAEVGNIPERVLLVHDGSMTKRAEDYV